MGLVVTDDEHEHAALGDTSAWNGDGIQLAFEMTGERPVAGNEALLLYNFALGDDGNLQIHYEKTLGIDAVDVAIARDEAGKKTYYEAKFSADELGVATFEDGMELALVSALMRATWIRRGKLAGVAGIPLLLFLGKTLKKQAWSGCRQVHGQQLSLPGNWPQHGQI